MRTLSLCSPSSPCDCVLPRTLPASLLQRLHSHGLPDHVVVGLSLPYIFPCRATAIYTYRADLRCLARTSGLLHSSPTFQEPSPVDILASYPLLWCLSQNRQPSLKRVLTIAPESTPSFTVTIALLGCCCRPTPRSILLVNAVPFARTTEDYYQHSPAMSAPLWQRPPCVLLLLSRLACDDCALVAKTASRAIIIFNACPRCLRPRGNNRIACYYYFQSST